MIRRPPRSTLSSSSAASDVYKRQIRSMAGPLPAPSASSPGQFGEPTLHWPASGAPQVYRFELPDREPLCVTQNHSKGHRPPDGSTDLSFTNGLVIWDSAIQLARFLLDRHVTVKGQRVLEIGAGAGLVGLVCAAEGATVMLTDYELPVLQLLEYNARANHSLHDGRASVARYDWNAAPPLDADWDVDLVVATDVIASATNAQLVAKVLNEVCNEHTEVWLCNEEFWSYHEEFLEALDPSFAVEEIASDGETGRLIKLQRRMC
eukprot:TRINITY_DN7319_c0_g1_i2.p1 TRINITY_DN7319_c0_g1~~TRINITY_DN7319_c0_g1_i2.p1  ORF type:complete len:263 (+),score=56.48 TRINITY_DN7319_c0_g1_i2:133-921(+)